MSNETSQPFIAQYDRQRGALPGQDLPWLAGLRDKGIQRFGNLGLPTPRAETWKYTNLRPLHKVDFTPAQVEEHPVSIDRAPSLLPEEMGYHRLVFVEGHLRPHLCSLGNLPEGAELDSLSGMLARDPGFLEAHLGQIGQIGDQPLMALNDAMMSEGFVLRLKPGVVLHQPLEIVHMGGASPQALAYHPRHLIAMEEGAQATVIEHHSGLGDSPYFANHATEIALGPDTLLRHYKLQAEGSQGFHVSTLHGRLDRSARYDSFTLSIGARLSRHEAAIRLEGEGADCHLNGAYLMRGEQHCDTTTLIEHIAPNTTCREIFKGVIDDKARAVFQGKLVVHRDAQHIAGHQLSKALLLSDQAEIDAKPELEIYADDVQCSHGATAGDLDHNALFYLRSRGIPEAQARKILIEAFLGEAINAIAAEGLCPALMSTVGHWLADA